MSAAMHKAAAVLGAAEVFHVLVEPSKNGVKGSPDEPKTIEEIYRAREEGRLQSIRLGRESGWPQFRRTSSAEFPLFDETSEEGVVVLTAPDDSFRCRSRAIVKRSHNVAGAWSRLSDLPFHVLVTWPEAQLDWLNKTVDPSRKESWIRQLPKVELHSHLRGFATEGALLETVRRAAQHPGRLPPVKPIMKPKGCRCRERASHWTSTFRSENTQAHHSFMISAA
ncbi:MAG: hypothetical protein N2652_11765 [Kiritimatiellae bacterium]|nr:hypothetical protein [Kiritimatiellia bacterium]